ncbi:MAG: DUF5050 domain-containing protein [Clostridia bacterium]|nr:DUF5050 domain-containing protein [Clostridia bacterium]
MEKQTKIIVMKCPSCGAPLKAENTTDPIGCVYCGNTVVPSADAPKQPEKESYNSGGTVRLEGIKTPSSALAYMEDFFEEYDWESFVHMPNLTIHEIDRLVSGIKVTSADDKVTWIACFRALHTPYLQKLIGCKQLLTTLIEDHKNEDPDAYSKFDTYKRVSVQLMKANISLKERLEKFLNKAIKYGATSEEITALRAEIARIDSHGALPQYETIESIPEIAHFDVQKNQAILQRLAAKGIDGDAEFQVARELLSKRDLRGAMDILSTLEGYNGSNKIIKRIDRYFRVSDVLILNNTLYIFKKNDAYESTSYALHPAVNGRIGEQPLIENIACILANYASLLYYIDTDGRLICYNLRKLNADVLSNETFDANTAVKQSGKKRVYLQTRVGYSNNNSALYELDLKSGKLQQLASEIQAILSIDGDKLALSIPRQIAGNEQIWYATQVIDLSARTSTILANYPVILNGYMGNRAIYTVEAPNDKNMDLYIRTLETNAPAQLLEKNIYRFCSIIAGKIFYYIGNSRNHTLISIDPDGSNRREWSLFVGEMLFEKSGWIYFTRRFGYNAVLCKARIDASDFQIIATDVERFVDIKNGYLYYINDLSTLIKVRMDGSNLQELCDSVEKVIDVQENQIIFTSYDDRILQSNGEDEFAHKTTSVKSIYAVNFTEGGKRKLAYNIKDANAYDENTVYFSSVETVPSEAEETRQIESLYCMDVKKNQTQKLLELIVEERAHYGFAIAMITMILLFIIGVIGFSAESPALGIIGILGGVLTAVIGAAIKSNNAKSS